MAWNDATEITVGNSGQVYVAPVGSTLPTDPTAAPDAAFFGLGYISEDGVTFSTTPDITDFRAWQSRQAVRRELNQQDLQAGFALTQWNEESVVLAFGGGEITSPSTGIYRYDFPDPGDALDERAMVVDVQDGDRNMRIVIPRGNITDATETQFRRSEMALLPITFRALQPTDGGPIGYVLFDDAAAFAAGS